MAGRPPHLMMGEYRQMGGRRRPPRRGAARATLLEAVAATGRSRYSSWHSEHWRSAFGYAGAVRAHTSADAHVIDAPSVSPFAHLGRRRRRHGDRNLASVSSAVVPTSGPAAHDAYAYFSSSLRKAS